jgi:hypothetical protein
MNATRISQSNYSTPVSVRLAAFAVAVLASAVVLGSTVAGLQPKDDAGMNVVAMERITITAPRVN